MIALQNENQMLIAVITNVYKIIQNVTKTKLVPNLLSNLSVKNIIGKLQVYK